MPETSYKCGINVQKLSSSMKESRILMLGHGRFRRSLRAESAQGPGRGSGRGRAGAPAGAEQGLRHENRFVI